jgi:dipeptidyl aminopeptidase/acylaminoacyl peptidase
MVVWGLYPEGRVYPKPPKDFNPHNKVVFVEDVMGKNGIMDFNFGEIVILDFGTGERFQITHDREYDNHPCWSPDGQQIIFESKRSKEDHPLVGLSRASHLYIIDIKSGSIRQIDKNFKNKFSNQLGSENKKPIWSPINKDLICFVTKPDISKGESVVLYNMQTDELKTLVSPEQLLFIYGLLWSPNGRYIGIECVKAIPYIYDLQTESLEQVLTSPITAAWPSGFSWDSSRLFLEASLDNGKNVRAEYHLKTKEYKYILPNIDKKLNTNYSKVSYQKANTYYLTGQPKDQYFDELYISENGAEPSQITFDSHNKMNFMVYPH